MGNIIQLKQSDQTKAYPKTVAEAVYMADGTNVENEVTELKNDLDAAEGDIEAAQGEIETLKDTAYIVNTAEGDIVTFSDGVAADVKALTVNVEPIQDLHGYDSPWPAGGGKNLINAHDITAVVDSDSQYTFLDSTITLAAGTYTLSFSVGATITATRNRPLYIVNGALVYAESDYKTQGRYSWTFTLDAETTLEFKWWGHTPSTNCVISNFMLESGSTATSYAPYSNICPITGRTGATVYRTGKNLFRLGRTASEFTESGITATPNADGSITVSGTADKNFDIQCDFGRWGNTPIELRSQTEDYAMTASYIMDGLWDAKCNVYCGYIKKDDSAAQYSIDTASKYRTFMMPKDAKKIRTWIRIPEGATVNGTIYIQTEYGSTATPYTPYTGTTLPISWETEVGTVYGGELDVVSGVLTMDKVAVDLGTLNWNIQDASRSLFMTDGLINNKSTNAGAICSKYRITDTPFMSMPDYTMRGTASNLQLWAIRDTTYSDVAAFKASLSGIQLVYELATPQTYQLTPQQVQTLLGDNVVWSDAGSVSVDYRADTKKYVDSLFDSIQKNMAYIETGTTASRAYTVGQYVIVNGTMYRVAAAIASGATFTPGTNIVATTVGTELTTALS